MDLGLNGRVALVTGASGAIGSAVAQALGAEGAWVAAGWHGNEAGARQAVDAVTRAMTVRMDQRDRLSPEAVIAEVSAALGPVAVLVANAVAWPERGPDSWDSLLDGFTANVVGTLALIEAALPGMRAAGFGRIVVISSDVVEQPLPAGVVYPAAKGALETAARVLAAREARHGILTNVVRPGFTLTERALTTPGFGQAVVDAEAARTPTGRIGTPRDVASAVAYLGSAANGHVNGEVLSVAGGRHLTR
jgi:NAD(P)-dependent dehydrogenase (short-subunit alcohol dehydrogenase family)